MIRPQTTYNLQQQQNISTTQKRRAVVQRSLLALFFVSCAFVICNNRVRSIFFAMVGLFEFQKVLFAISYHGSFQG